MKKYSSINKKISSLVLFMLLSLSSRVVLSQDRIDKYQDVSNLIDVWIEYEKDYKNIPFISGVVVDDQEILWSGAFGHTDVEDSILGNENTMTSVCSISKVFTATLIMKLVDQGKINLDDKVKDLLPRYSVIQKFPESSEVTISSLLSHTSGLPRDTNHGYWSAPEQHPFPSKNELFESLASQETIYPVGTTISYSNIGYALLGQVIEEVTGKSYKSYVESNLFQPLNMSNSLVEMQPSLYGNKHAIGYSAPSRYGKRERAIFYQAKAMQPAMGISTTALDLAKFAQWQFRLADSSNSEIMRASTLKSMYQTTKTKEGKSNRGFGYVINSTSDGREWAMHGGICPGYTSFFRMDLKNKKAYAFLVSSNKGDAMKYINSLSRLFDKADNMEFTRHEEKSALNLSDYTGFWSVSPWNSDYYIGKWGSGLVALHFPVESLKYSLRVLRHVEGDVFQVIENGELIDEEVIYYRNNQGKVVKVKSLDNYNVRTVQAKN